MSGRIRTLKPEILEDAVTAGLSDTAFRIFTSAIVLADDYGNFRAETAFLRGQIYWKASPSSDVDEAIRELASLIQFYEERGQRYGHVKNWEKHQKVSHRGKPRVPPPPKASGESPESLTKSPAILVPDLRPTTTTTTTTGIDSGLLPSDNERHGITPITSTGIAAAAFEAYADALRSVLGTVVLDQRYGQPELREAINQAAPSGLTLAELLARLTYSAKTYAEDKRGNAKYEGGFKPKSWGRWLSESEDNAETFTLPPPEARSGIHKVAKPHWESGMTREERMAAAEAGMALLEGKAVAS